MHSVGHRQPLELCPLLGLQPATLWSLQGAKDWTYSRPWVRCIGSNLGMSRDDLLSPPHIYSQKMKASNWFPSLILQYGRIWLKYESNSLRDWKERQSMNMNPVSKTKEPGDGAQERRTTICCSSLHPLGASRLQDQHILTFRFLYFPSL